MNTLMLVALAVVAFCYCGGKYCPKVLSSNKEVVLGVLVGMALCSFAGLRLEGLMVNPECCRGGVVSKDSSGKDVIEWDDGVLQSECGNGDEKSPEYEPNAIKWGERCSNMRTFSSGDGPVRANLSVGGSCSNDNECRRGLTCVDGRCASGETLTQEQMNQAHNDFCDQATPEMMLNDGFAGMFSMFCGGNLDAICSQVTPENMQDANIATWFGENCEQRGGR